MQLHTKIYLDHFKVHGEDFIPCEICGCKAVDIHHIDSRGMGGSKHANTIENLMALCRSCHETYGDIKEYRDLLVELHLNVIKYKTPSDTIRIPSLLLPLP